MSTAGFIASMVAVFLFGLAAIGVLYYLTEYDPNTQTTTSLSPVTSEPVSLTLNLSSPDDNLLNFTPDILISGSVTPGAVVILSTNSADEPLEVSNKGDFSTTFKLKEGANALTIFAFDSIGNSEQTSRTIYYSKEKI